MPIVPGTGLLTDADGLFGWGPYSLFKWSLIAKVCRCKLLLVSVGAGPIYGILGRWRDLQPFAWQYRRPYRHRPASGRAIPFTRVTLPSACFM